MTLKSLFDLMLGGVGLAAAMPPGRGRDHEVDELNRHLERIIKQQESLMTALENLTQAITDNTAAVDRVVTILGTPHPTDAQVQAAADALNSQTQRLTAAADAAQGVTPTPPPAVP